MSGGLPSRHDLSGENHQSVNNSIHSSQRSVDDVESPLDSVGSVPPMVFNLPPVSFNPPPADAALGSATSNFPPCQAPPTVGKTYNGGPNAVKFKVVGKTLQPSKVISNVCRRHCFTQHIEEGAFNWSKMSQRTKNLYWGEFLKYAQWENVNPETIYKLWMKKARSCYRDYVGKDLRNHKKEGLPRGCSQRAYDALKEYWNSHDFMVKSARNKGNRTKNGKAYATYHGGCKGTWQWAIELAKDNKPSDPHSVMVYCFTKKHDGKTFTNVRAEKIDGRYVEELQRVTQSQTDTGSSVEEVEKNLYKQIVMEEGGVGHGRIYGLGSASSIIYGDVNEFGPPQQMTPQVPPEYVAQLKKMEEETAALKIKEKMLEEALRLQSQHLCYMSQFFPPPPPPQTQPHMQMQGMNFTQMLGSQPTQFPYFQGAAAGPMLYGQPSAGAPVYSQPGSALPVYSQAAPAAVNVPQAFQAPSSVVPNATPSWANNYE